MSRPTTPPTNRDEWSKWDFIANGVCPKCGKESDTVDEQYSFGVYAGVMCRECAMSGFRDQCGHGPEGQGSPQDLDEPYDED